MRQLGWDGARWLVGAGCALALACGAASAPAFAQDRDAKVRNDKQQTEEVGQWIYNDLATGFRIAKNEGKPLLVVLRCVP